MGVLFIDPLAATSGLSSIITMLDIGTTQSIIKPLQLYCPSMCGNAYRVDLNKAAQKGRSNLNLI